MQLLPRFTGSTRTLTTGPDRSGLSETFPTRATSMTIVHVNNTCVIMGTALHTLTMVRAYPEHRHVVVFLFHDPEKTSTYLLAEFRNAGAEIVLGPGKPLCWHHISKFDPAMVIVNNGHPDYLHSDLAALLMRDKVLVSYSHDLDIACPSTFNIWNSDFTMRLHDGQSRDTPTIVMGSFIDTAPFAAIEREYGDRIITGMLTTGPARFHVKLTADLLILFMRIRMRHPDMKFIVPNANRVLALPEWCSSPDYTQRSVEQFYSDVDIFVHYTKKTSSDGWGRPVTEAMASGLPVVAERRGGVVEQIEDGVDGFLCDTNDEFVERIDQLYADPALRRRIGEAAKAKAVERFGIPAIRDTLKDVFALAAERSAGRAAREG